MPAGVAATLVAATDLAAVVTVIEVAAFTTNIMPHSTV